MVDTLVVVVVVMVWDKATSESNSVFSMETGSLITGSECGYERENGELERAVNEEVGWSTEGEDFMTLDCRTASLGSSTMCKSTVTGGEGSGEWQFGLEGRLSVEEIVAGTIVAEGELISTVVEKLLD